MERLSATTNALNWFEIPVIDIQRATTFYERIFEIKMLPLEMLSMKMSAFPSRPPHAGGSLVQSPMHKPSSAGAVVYLNGNPDLDIVLNRVEFAGGKVLMPKKLISPQAGYMAFFEDTEGNKIGLHSSCMNG